MGKYSASQQTYYACLHNQTLFSLMMDCKILMIVSCTNFDLKLQSVPNFAVFSSLFNLFSVKYLVSLPHVSASQAVESLQWFHLRYWNIRLSAYSVNHCLHAAVAHVRPEDEILLSKTPFFSSKLQNYYLLLLSIFHVRMVAR